MANELAVWKIQSHYRRKINEVQGIYDRFLLDENSFCIYPEARDWSQQSLWSFDLESAFVKPRLLETFLI